jgi:hypothetical protein
MPYRNRTQCQRFYLTTGICAHTKRMSLVLLHAIRRLAVCCLVAVGTNVLCVTCVSVPICFVALKDDDRIKRSAL